MAKNNEVLPNSDLSECSKRMRAGNQDDDTEDYIQPSQPSSIQSPCLAAVSKKISTESDNPETSISTTDESLPFPKSKMSTLFGDISHDFIPESEDPVKREINNSCKEEGCKKRLNLDESSPANQTPDMFLTQSQVNDTMDVSHLRLAQNPSEIHEKNVSLVPESPARINETLETEHSYTMFSEDGKRSCLGETIEESSKACEYEIRRSRESGNIAENASGQIITVDSSRFTDDSGMVSLLRPEKTSCDASMNKKIDSQETQLDDTVDAEDMNCYSLRAVEEKDDSERLNGDENSVEPVANKLCCSVDRDSDSVSLRIDAKPEISRLKSTLKNISDEELARLQKHSTPENPLSKSPKINESTSSIENGTPPIQDDAKKSSEINFTIYLQLDCQLVLDPRLGEPISKKIIDVKELPKRQPKQFSLETNCDSSYKTKRLSSSSSGSVYSDKTGLPYPLPTRPLPVSINSSSSSVDLAKHIKIVDRQVWVNEYKIPMAIDDVIPRYVQHHKIGLRTNVGLSGVKRKMSMRVRGKSDWSHTLDNFVEGSSNQSSTNNSDDSLLPPDESASAKPMEKLPKKERVELDVTEDAAHAENSLLKAVHFPCDETSVSAQGIITQDLLVFARWTDKRYYPGKVVSKAKYDRWQVKFDDDTEKEIREELILPMNWVKKGELVFALTADKYASGKIADIIRDEEMKFKIELDETNEEIVVKKCDLCLNDVMVGIIREKFKPGNKVVPPQKSCDINVDNVVTGKRTREQRTPIRRTASITQPESLTAKKRRGGGRRDTPAPQQRLNSDSRLRTSRKRGTREAPSDSVLPMTGEAEATVFGLDSDGRKKRVRSSKFDSNGSEFSSGKVRKSENSTREEARETLAREKDWKPVRNGTEEEMGEDRKAENRRMKQATPKEVVNDEEKKGEVTARKLVTRPGKSKSSTIKKKRKI